MKPLARNLLIASLGILAVVSGWRIVAHSRADAALYRAKHGGRNQTNLAEADADADAGTEP